MNTEEDFQVAASIILDIERFLAKLAEVEIALIEWALTGAEGPGLPESKVSFITSLRKKLKAPLDRALLGCFGDLNKVLGLGRKSLVLAI